MAFGGGRFGGGLFGGPRFGAPAVQQNYYQLQHNEYIVYNTEQIRMRYIVQIDQGKNAFF